MSIKKRESTSKLQYGPKTGTLLQKYRNVDRKWQNFDNFDNNTKTQLKLHHKIDQNTENDLKIPCTYEGNIDK